MSSLGMKLGLRRFIISNIIDPNIISLEVSAGYFDFSWNGGGTWYFPDGSTSTDVRPSRTLADGTVLLKCDDITGNYQLKDNHTDSYYIGNLSSLSNLTYYIDCTYSINLKGDISNLAKLTNYANFYNCPLLTLSKVFEFKVTYANFSYCDLSELEIQYLVESLVLGGKIIGTVKIEGTNAGANALALAAIATLESRNWSVTYNTII